MTPKRLRGDSHFEGRSHERTHGQRGAHVTRGVLRPPGRTRREAAAGAAVMDGSGEQPRDGGEAGGRRAGGGQAPPPAGPTIAPVSLEPCDLQALGQKLLDRALPASSPLPPGGGSSALWLPRPDPLLPNGLVPQRSRRP